MAEEKKVEETQLPPQMPKPTKDQQLMMAFQGRLNVIVSAMNDLLRDVRDIQNAKE